MCRDYEEWDVFKTKLKSHDHRFYLEQRVDIITATPVISYHYFIDIICYLLILFNWTVGISQLKIFESQQPGCLSVDPR